MYVMNQPVNVSAFFFRGGNSFRSFPSRIEFNNDTFTFNDGIQYQVRKGQHIVKLFDMTDGRLTYRLRYESGAWTLVSTKESA